jgi:hypothetical protein
MVRILFEISLPAHSLGQVREALSPDVLPTGVSGRIEALDTMAGCESLAAGGDAGWTPCWISLEASRPGTPGLDGAVRHLKEVIVASAREGKVELFSIPATAQIGEAFLRFRDLLEIVDRLG